MPAPSYFSAGLAQGDRSCLAKLRRALREHGTIEGAARALGFTSGRQLRKKGERYPHIRRVLETAPTISTKEA